MSSSRRGRCRRPEMQQGRPRRLSEFQIPGCWAIRLSPVTPCARHHEMTMDEQAVRAFWSMHPLRGDAQLSGLDDAFSGDHDAFFTEYARRNRSIASEPGVAPSRTARRVHASIERRPVHQEGLVGPHRPQCEAGWPRGACCGCGESRAARTGVTEPTTRSRACTTRATSAATSPTSSWSSATSGTCPARGRLFGWHLWAPAADLTLRRATACSPSTGRWCLPRTSMLRRSNQRSEAGRRRAPTRRDVDERQGAGRVVSVHAPLRNNPMPTPRPTTQVQPSDDNVHRALNPREKRTTDGRGPTKLFTRLSTHEPRRVDRGDVLATRGTGCCWGLGCRAGFSRWRTTRGCFVRGSRTARDLCRCCW